MEIDTFLQKRYNKRKKAVIAMGGKKSRESQIRASVKYNKAHDYFGIRPNKEIGAAIRQAAAAADQSVQRYILDAVQSRMEYDAWKNAHDFPGEVGPPNL